MFVRKTRDDGTVYVTLTDEAPEWLRTAVMDAHDGEMPNDWRYSTCEAIWAAFTVDEIDPTDEDQRIELADSLVDTHTADLLGWLADNLSRTFDVDHARDEFGHGDSLMDDIMAGQLICVRQMITALADAIVTAYESYTDECEAEELEAHDLHMWAVHGCPDGPI